METTPETVMKTENEMLDEMKNSKDVNQNDNNNPDKKRRNVEKKETLGPYIRTTTPTTRARMLFLRTYQRKGESYDDVMRRVEQHLMWQYQKGTGRSLSKEQKNEIKELMQLIVDGKVSCAGRTLWLGGTSLIENPNEVNTTTEKKKKKRECSQFNCSFLKCSTANELRQVFHLLLQGCGVGVKMVSGTLFGFKNKIPNIQVIRSTRKEKNGNENTKETFDNGVWKIEIGDSSDAWSIALECLIRCNIPLGFKIKTLVIDCSQIRPAGSILGSYGWTSQGDAKIAYGFERIANILNNKVDLLLSKMDILDIICHLGTVLSTRRSAIICLMDADDPEWREFASAKDRYWERNNEHRAQSNNSLVFYSKPSREKLSEIFDIMARTGGSEPGFINGEAAKKRAPYFEGVNPCGEILLPNKGFCNLVEVNLLAFPDDMPGLHRALELVARMNYRQTIVNLNDGVLDDTWTDNNNFLHLCGVSCTGIAARDDLTEYDWQKMREIACNSARRQAIEFNMPPSKNVTCVKPSGCCAPDTLVSTNHGLLRLDEIGDINGKEWQDKTEEELFVSQESSFHRVTKFYVNGHNVIRVLKFASGLILKCTPHHQLRVWNSQTSQYEWREAKDIKVGTKDSLMPYRLGFFSPDTTPLDDIYVVTQKLGFIDLIPTTDDIEESVARKFNLSNMIVGFLFWMMGAFNHRLAFVDPNAFEFHLHLSSKMPASEVELCNKILSRYFKYTTSVEDITEIVKEHVGKNLLKIKGKGIFEFMMMSKIKLTDDSSFFPKFIRTSSSNAIIAFLSGSQGHGFTDFCVYDQVEYDTQRLFQNGIEVSKERYGSEILVMMRAIGIDVVMKPKDELCVAFIISRGSPSSDSYKNTVLNALFENENNYGLDVLVSNTESEMVTYDIEVPENNCYVAASIISHNTLSKCFGTEEYGEVPEGIHKPLGQFIFNNVNFNKLDPVVNSYREAGYKVIDHPNKTERETTVLITLPIKYSSKLGFTEVTVKRKNGNEEKVMVNTESARIQLDRYKKINKNWANHNTSSTISYSPDEVEDIIEWFEANWDDYVGVSFIYRNDPTKNATDLGHPYLPQEVVTEKDYVEYVSKLKKVNFDFISKGEEENQSAPIEECEGGACPIR
jgi:hypothetical protein